MKYNTEFPVTYKSIYDWLDKKIEERRNKDILTKEKALELLRAQFHKTRLTKEIYVDPDIVAAILGYEVKLYKENKENR